MKSFSRQITYLPYRTQDLYVTLMVNTKRLQEWTIRIKTVFIELRVNRVNQ
jgi:hypothetical protein